MKTITIDVPRTGSSVELVLREGVSLGQVVVVASDDVEIRLKDVVPAVANQSRPLPTKPSGKSPSPVTNPIIHDLDVILRRLIKLKPTKRGTAVNSIKAMFHLTDPISDETASKILEDLRRRGSLSIGANDKIQFRTA